MKPFTPGAVLESAKMLGCLSEKSACLQVATSEVSNHGKRILGEG
jgi:hypothetical protein